MFSLDTSYRTWHFERCRPLSESPETSVHSMAYPTSYHMAGGQPLSAHEQTEIHVLSSSTTKSTSQSSDIHSSQVKPQSRQIHRNRASYSCHSCRRRKIKCDRGHPVCSNCVKVSETCVYNDNSTIKENSRSRLGSTVRLRSPTEDSPPGTNVAKRQKQSKDAHSTRDLSSANVTNRRILPVEEESPSLGYESSLALSPLNLSLDGPQDIRMTRIAEALDQWYADALELAKAGRQTPESEVTITQKQLSAFMEQRDKLQRMIQATTSDNRIIKSRLNSSMEGSIGKVFSDWRNTNTEIGHLSIREYGGTQYWAPGHRPMLEQEESARLKNLKPNRNQSAFLCPTETGVLPTSLWPWSSYSRKSKWTFSDVLDADSLKAALNPTFFNIITLMGPYYSSLQVQHIILLKSYPGQEAARLLYRAYLRNIHPTLPLIHPPTFEQEMAASYQRYETRLTGHIMNSETSFVCLFFAVLLAGAMTLSAEDIEMIFDGKNKELVTDQLLDAANSALCIFNFPGSPTTDALIAFLLVHCSLLDEARLPSQNVVGTAMRAAQTMGMHRDGGLFGLTDLECETRRRIWWYIMYRDTINAVQTGLPPQGGSNEDLYDTKMVSELQDVFIKAEDEELPRDISSNCIRKPSERVPLINSRDLPEESKKISPIMLTAIGRYEITKFLHKIICRQLSIRPVTQDDVLKMACLNNDLSLRIKYIIEKIQKCPPMALGADPATSGSIVLDGTYFNWACEMLRFHCGVAGTLFYQPFLKNPKAKSWFFARDCGVSTCQQLLDAFVKLYTTEAFRPWIGSCPGTAQLQHAVTILIIDLHDRLHTDEAPESRRLVDAVFAIYDRSEEDEFHYSGENKSSSWQALMRKSAHEWEMLRRLKNDAYHRAGLQPSGESLIYQVGTSTPSGVASECSQSSPTSQHHDQTDLSDASRIQSPHSVQGSGRQWTDNGTLHHNTPTVSQAEPQDLVADQRIAQMVREQYLATTSGNLTTTQSLIMTTDAIPAPVFPPNLLNMIDEIDYNWGEWSHHGNYMMQMPQMVPEQRANMRFDYHAGGQ